MASGKRKNPTSRLGKVQKVWRWTHVHFILFLLAISFVLTLFVGGVLSLYILLDIPEIGSIKNYRPAATTVILDNRGKEIAHFYSQNRYVRPLSQMPDLLPKAFVAAEDARFYQHPGVDGWSVLRALFHNIKVGRRGQGGSTITQQVARSLLLSPEKTYLRKIKEAILAYRIDSVLSKDEILHIYVNQIYFGEGAYGIEAAAMVYFGKHAGELSLSEFSLLAGLPQAPSRYSPFNNYRLAKRRQAYVLNRMAENGYITPTEARNAYKKSLFWGPAFSFPQENKYFVQQVRSYVEQKYGSRLLSSGGLTVYTTLDQTLQKTATEAVRNGVVQWLKRQHFKFGNAPQAALVVMEVESSHVKAIVGGTNFARSQFNRAVSAKRQPGSAFKPLIYAAALARGSTPADIVNDEPIRLQGAAPGKMWEPKNFSGRHYGPTTLRDGLVFSRNIVTIKLLQNTGVSEVIELARKIGIKSELAPDLSLALGASGVSLLELTSAYATFGRGGAYVTPVFVTKILDRDGNVLEENRPIPKRALDAQTAYQVTHLLKAVIQEGTGRRAKVMPVPAAGKTGTTDQYMDAWFIGYTPDLAAGVWVGYDQNISLGSGETGGRAAVPIWLDFMLGAREYLSSRDFAVPNGIIFKAMNSRTGKLGESGSADTAWVAFRTDSVPAE